MATNKHAVIRYQALDKCFSNFGRRFYIEDLIEACEKAIYEYSGVVDGVKRRQVYADIAFMESEEGFSIPLERYADGHRKYYRYTDKNFSINSQPLNATESEQLKNTILMLNRFKGLPQFDWMNEVLTRLEDSFKLTDSQESVVSFEQNPYLRGLNHFTDLFNAIINKQVLEIDYSPSFRKSQKYAVHPYYLKQYNNRWFLFGLYGDRIINMPLDRIEGFCVKHEVYVENRNIDFEEYFDDVVGVSIPNGKNVERVRLKIDRDRYNYIETKPLHPSQRVILKEEGYVVIELNVILNYEFETTLLTFADSIDILEPEALKLSVCRRAEAILKRNI